MPRDPIYEMCGVYAIICTGDGSIYIGSTGSSFGTRWAEHRMEQGGYQYGQGGNRLLRAAYTQFGIESFQFIILEIVPCHKTTSYLRQRERYWYKWFRKHWGKDRMLNVVERISLRH
jgi:group I intron endonuclease